MSLVIDRVVVEALPSSKFGGPDTALPHSSRPLLPRLLVARQPRLQVLHEGRESHLRLVCTAAGQKGNDNPCRNLVTGPVQVFAGRFLASPDASRVGMPPPCGRVLAGSCPVHAHYAHAFDPGKTQVGDCPLTGQFFAR